MQVFYNEREDPIPLSLADFMEIDENDYVATNNNNETMLIVQRKVDQFAHWNVDGRHDLPELGYTVTSVKVPFLYDWCKDQLYFEMDERDDEIPKG